MEHVRITCDETEWRVGSRYAHLGVTRDGRVKNLTTGRELALTVGKTGYAQFAMFGARALAREYGVHHKQIISAARGESWPHLDGGAS